MWKRRVISAAVLAYVVVLLVQFAKPSYRQGEPSVAGRPAPDFAFTLDGQPTKLTALEGKIVVLNFWATWCPPCVEETPSLEQMYRQLASSGVAVLGVSVDEDAAAYRKFLVDNHITFPTTRDPSADIPRAYGTSLYPETYIIGRNGRIVRTLIGEQSWDSPGMLAYLRDLAAGKRPTSF
jgi:peroxiredoxin